ncbi:MAG: hypothetical protein ACRED9_08510 [Caulobacteraceae bacterium]
MKARRDSLAFVLSAGFHLLFIALFIYDFTPELRLPSPAPAPMQVEIVPPENQPPPIVIQVEPAKTIPLPPKIQRQTAPPPSPVTAKAETPPKPQPPIPVPTAPRPEAVQRFTAPKAVSLARAKVNLSTPTAATNFKAAPIPQAAPTPAPAQAAKAAPRTLELHLHESPRKAPPGVAGLPLAPSPSRSSAAGPAGQGRSGLSSLPYGVMPSGGSGLRGSLIGCANAQAVGLSQVERAHCADRFGEDMADAPRLDQISPARRAEFDKTADKQERERRNEEAPMPTGTTPSGPGMGYGLGH